MCSVTAVSETTPTCPGNNVTIPDLEEGVHSVPVSVLREEWDWIQQLSITGEKECGEIGEEAGPRIESHTPLLYYELQSAIKTVLRHLHLRLEQVSQTHTHMYSACVCICVSTFIVFSAQNHKQFLPLRALKASQL